MGPTPYRSSQPETRFTVSGYDGITSGSIVISYDNTTSPHCNYPCPSETLEEKKKNAHHQSLGENQLMRRQRAAMYKNDWRYPPPQSRGAKTRKD